MSVVAALKPLARKTARAPARTTRALSDGAAAPSCGGRLGEGVVVLERPDELAMCSLAAEVKLDDTIEVARVIPSGTHVRLTKVTDNNGYWKVPIDSTVPLGI
jgi:hypothetical protein